jgi:xanthine dehydrogenase accessory factor
MKEIKEIIAAYRAHYHTGQPSALATVVQVDGSAYRRPGARMFVTASGQLTGAISGGCLEGDALRKAQAVIFQNKAKLVTYDTTDEDDQKFGVGLGCNGIIHVLIEPIDYNNPQNPVELLIKTQEKREISIVATLFSVPDPDYSQAGTLRLYKEKKIFGNSKLPENLEAIIVSESEDVAHSGKQMVRIYPELDGLAIFYQKIYPPIRLLLFGAGNDTKPLAAMANLLGWEVILIDGRSNHATKERFPSVDQILVGQPDELLPQIETDAMTVALLMTHNFEYEKNALTFLNSFHLPYIGILGPKKKTEKMLNILKSNGEVIIEDNLYAPIGLDIGAEGPEEIALAVCAEIRAVLNKKTPFFLRDKNGPIHHEK